ncbi:penicillin-binding protein 2 [Dethiosulfovibrio sp. F2B]|uniref:penicillin-binding protein 2 n=1 Tax=Dethiosulfovibrio faecalis TaxID=2720018 RepID=UPI001F4764EE|nr:penicillin-binding protein 2 [Dethiosulfovibrio faecalis]MCF4152222.1 penicillin-binding protein 2 [Dethiosulfovibrio faecalis]
MFDDKVLLNSRLRLIRIALMLSMLVLFSGLLYYQVFRSDKYVKLATSNKLRVVRLPARRGRILDANGVLLANNVLTFDIVGYPLDLRKEGILSDFADLLGRHGIPLTEEILEKRIKKQYVVPYRSVVLLRNLTLPQVTDLVGDPEFPPQLFHLPVWRRTYPVGALVCHVLGYVGEISEQELKELGQDGETSRFVGGDVIGKGGVEQFYEDRLQGYPGHKVLEVDARGRFVRILSGRKPVPGEDLSLTLDLGAQKFAADLLGESRGAVIAMDLRSGGLKVLYSNPTFDLNPLAWGVSSKEWRDLVSDPHRPMMNRAISGTYSPGSVYKPVVAYAALADGVVTEKTTFFCSGKFELGNQVFRCHRRWGHGNEDLVGALRDSCDVYFYEVGQRVGIDSLVRWGKVFGIGLKTGIDLPGESEGNIAGRDWKEKRFGDRWYKGDTVNYSIGQGFLLMTPIQILRQFGALATGKLLRPHLFSDAASPPVDLGLSPKFLKVVQKGMAAVVKPKGTGWRAGIYGVSVAGKTGTVQNSGEDHAVFGGYAPAENPRYAVVAFVEEGLHGSTAAAPIVGQLLAYLVKNDEGGSGGASRKGK